MQPAGPPSRFAGTETLAMHACAGCGVGKVNG
jgi:hypothetical protein